MAIRPNPTRRCLENPALGSMPGNLSSTSSFLLLPFLRLSSPSAFRVSSARYCRYFQTQHEQPASAMDETVPRDTRRMMEEEERERKRERQRLTIVEIGMFSDIEIIIYFELFLGCCIMTDIEIEITGIIL